MRYLAACIPFLLLGGCSSKEPPPVADVKLPVGPVKITQLYASPPNPPPGQKSLVCYSTENATSVKLDPPDAPVWPSPSRCFEVIMKKKVTYTLTAERDAERISKMVTLAPGIAPPELVEVHVDALEVPKGTPMHVCYKAKNAGSVTVTPGQYLQHEPDRGCVMQVMEQTTRFQVRVRDAGGDIVDGEDVEVRVR